MPPEDKLDGEWLEALEVDAPADDAPVDNVPADDAPVDDKPVDDKPVDDAPVDDKPADDAPVDDAPVVPPTEKDTTKEAIKEALLEIDNAKQAQAATIDSYKKEVTETLYPEGIDRQLRDSDGDPITGIDDLTKLVNPRTGELFTDEEAGSWLLSAQQKLNKDIEQVENFIEQVAEVNANIKTGAERVAEKYGEILKGDDALRQRLVAAYDKTLVKDPKTGVTINNPVDVEEFFDMALEPRLATLQANAEAAAEAEKLKTKQLKDNQSDRSDLKPSGQSERLAPEDKEWAEAIKDYEKGA